MAARIIEVMFCAIWDVGLERRIQQRLQIIQGVSRDCIMPYEDFLDPYLGYGEKKGDRCGISNVAGASRFVRLFA